MNTLKLLSTVVISLFFVGCSFAPLTTPTSGRSLGAGNWEINASLIPTVGATVARGFSDNFDAGIILEQQFGPVISAYGKYSIINNPEGMALGVYGGAFVGSGFGSSRGFYVAPIISHRSDWFEVYLSVRYASVTWDIGELTADEVDDSVFTLTPTDTDFSFGYLQSDLGFNFWFSKTFAWNIHAKHWLFLSDDIESDNSLIPGTALIFNF